eukprot:3564901-Pyramimonas_sp.AAC.1
MIDASQKAISDSDDDCIDGENLNQGERSTAQPVSSSPDAVRAVRNTQEATGMTPRPRTKKPKGDNDDLNTSPVSQGLYIPDFSLPRTDRNRVPELDELVIEDERDDLARSMDVDAITRG